jgi:hypothetical protein
VFISQKTTCFIVAAVKTSDLTQHYPAGVCNRDIVSPVRYELGFYAPEDGILQSPL